ncbi:alpha/beta hydrolase [Nitrospirillum sp. BR 11828]|uniref:alpha/beta hydrolase n=1 Tax=Nitrospirillum sp. BR 11828 TaxID=3104325 RepID=UPI002ACA2BDA|nr:alpha/beta hydrolase [Nitrospirillum sp. BR 11828]MDZ5647294.1 alpha/beta hydrolase [Nitrospirillum sp. BR 11828]
MTFTPNRRGLALAALAGAALGSAAMSRQAQADGGTAADLVRLSRQRRDPDVVLPLWPGTPPGGEGLVVKDLIIDHAPVGGPPDRSADHVAMPTLAFFRSASPGPRATILIIPGGGYTNVWFDKEGYEVARWLNTTGVHAAVLTYRLPAEGWKNGPDVPLQDAQRAMRLLRHKAKAWAVDGGRLGILGFSAGGHLAASLLTRHDATVYAAVDEADTLPAGPQLACLAYPVISMDESLTHAGSRQHLLGNAPTAAQVTAYSPDQTVPAGACPTFLFHAADDGAVPVGNSLAMFQALRRQNVATEMHIFESGGHGFALREIPGRPAEPWPDLYRRWLGRHGFV